MPRMSRCCQCYPPVPDIVSTITVTSAVSGPDQRRSLCKAEQLTITMSGIKLALVSGLVAPPLAAAGWSLCLTVSGAAAAVLPGCWLARAATAEAAPHSSISIRPPTKYFSGKIWINENQSDICCLWENDWLSLLIQNMIFSNIYIFILKLGMSQDVTSIHQLSLNICYLIYNKVLYLLHRSLDLI